MEIRDLRETDLAAALALNNAAVPALNALVHDELAWLVGESAHALAVVAAPPPVPGGGTGEVVNGERAHPAPGSRVRDETLIGFCVTLAPGLAYESLNYRWFSARFESFTYLDRIVVDPAHRSSGAGTAMYAELERRIAGVTPWLLCEVNVRPLNAGSLRFHQRIGFREVGQQDTDEGRKTVSLLAKSLA